MTIEILKYKIYTLATETGDQLLSVTTERGVAEHKLTTSEKMSHW